MQCQKVFTTETVRNTLMREGQGCQKYRTLRLADIIVHGYQSSQYWSCELDDQLKIFLCYFIFIFPMACGFNAHYNSHILLLAQNLSMRVHTNRGNMFSRSENSVVSLKLDFGIRTAGYLKNVICSVCSLETNYCFCS